MAYVAVKGGKKAIEESIKRLHYERLKDKIVIDHTRIRSGMRCLIDQVMSESSLYSETLAAIALKQAEGCLEEAVFLLRSYKSTIPRKYYSRIVNPERMDVERRISAGFKDIPGGQILGAAYDYTHRLIDFNIMEETDESAKTWIENYLSENIEYTESSDLSNIPKVIDYLRKEGLMFEYSTDNTEPSDITKKSIEFPTVRSERLQILTRGQTGTVTSLGYASLRGYGQLHPTVGELRIGKIQIYIDNPFKESDSDDDSYHIGEIKITEVESIIPKPVEKNFNDNEINFEIGYGVCYGQNETKAIAMSILDQCLETKDPRYPTHNEEFVLMSIDSVESTGFISHLKLPHYVTFQSLLDSVRKTKKPER